MLHLVTTIGVNNRMPVPHRLVYVYRTRAMIGQPGPGKAPFSAPGLFQSF